MTVTLSVRWVARSGEKESVAATLRQLVEPIRAEVGCLQGDVYRDAHDPRVFVPGARDADDRASGAHANASDVRELVLAQPLPLRQERVRTYLDPLV